MQRQRESGEFHGAARLITVVGLGWTCPWASTGPTAPANFIYCVYCAEDEIGSRQGVIDVVNILVLSPGTSKCMGSPVAAPIGRR